MRANFNRAATSATKIQPVIDVIERYVSSNSFESVGRGSGMTDTMEAVLEARMALASLLGAESPNHIIFTSGATESLNILIGGLIGLGKVHMIISGFEHNAVARPAHALANAGLAKLSIIQPVSEELERAMASEPHLPTVLIMLHASNVFGHFLPIETLFRLAKSKNAYTVLDASQTLGHVPVKMTEYIDAIAFTAHKGMRALPGSGGFAISSSLSRRLMPWKQGGTGSVSDLLVMPDFLPDKFEAGTPNTLGILALGAAAVYVEENIAEICRRERELLQYLLASLRNLPVTIHRYNPKEEDLIPVVSITVEGYDSSLLAEDLDRRYGIRTRSGLHCSPLAHRTMGTFPEGTLRLSLNSDNTREEIDYLVSSLKTLIEE